jgi:hypothetical protein
MLSDVFATPHDVRVDSGTLHHVPVESDCRAPRPLAGDAQEAHMMQGKNLTDIAIETLATHVRGESLRPGGDGYEEARGLWNAMIDDRPAIITRCTGVADVIAAVAFAREHGLTVAVRGGGHNVAGLASVSDGMMIDLSRMRAVLAPTRRSAWHRQTRRSTRIRRSR